jgi:hypothetical protein
LVQGVTGSSATTSFSSSDTDVWGTDGTVESIGTTAGVVDITGERWAVNDSVFNAGETLVFSISNFSLTTSVTGEDGLLASGTFTGIGFQETGRGYGHVVVLGDVGTNQVEARFNSTNYNIAAGSFSEGDQMYVTSANLGDLTSSNPQRFGVSNTDFTITIIPEPNSYALLAGLAGLSFVMLRRRQA